MKQEKKPEKGQPVKIEVTTTRRIVVSGKWIFTEKV